MYVYNNKIWVLLFNKEFYFNFGNLLVIWNLIKLLNIFIMIIIDIKNENIDFKLCFLKLKDINLFIVLNKKKILL